MSSSNVNISKSVLDNPDNTGGVGDAHLDSNAELLDYRSSTQRLWTIPNSALLDFSVFFPLSALCKTARHLSDVQQESITRINARVGTARVVGEFVVNTGWKSVQKRLIGEQSPRLSQSYKQTKSSMQNEERLEPMNTTATTSQGNIPSSTPGAGPRNMTPNPEVLEVLAGYDSLTAAQVIKRLPGIGRSGLMAIKLHETNSRNRKSVLNALDQLVHTRSDEAPRE